MVPSQETLRELASRTGFGAAELEIVVRLRELLRAINEDEYLQPRVALKGGTPLNLCFGPPPRLSVDLDFNYIGAAEREMMLAERPVVIAAAEKLSRREGYRVQRSGDEHAGCTLFLSYRSALGHNAQLRLDLNFQFRLPLLPVQSCEIWDPLSLGPVRTTVVSSKELVVGKMLALVARTAARDLYDAARISRAPARFEIDAEARSLFIGLSAMLPRALSAYGIERLERVAAAEVVKTLHPLLRHEERPSVADLVRDASALVRPWLTLSEAEREYVDRVQRGEVHPELLFLPDDPLIGRVRSHPVVRWKADNARTRRQ